MDSTSTPEVTSLTIPKGDESLPPNAKELATGDMITVMGKVAANDENGLTFEVTGVEKSEEEPEPDADDTPTTPENEGDEGDEAAPVPDDGAPSTATSYVMKRRKMMSSE